ncbi:MAG: insulinase family protein [Proteobacteria bacterium]|nr:insulinase family protein [Pseudomonadota bacterium]
MRAIKLISLVLCFVTGASAWAGPKIQTWQLENGTRVLFAPARDLPMVQMSLVFDAGSARDQKGRYGLAAFVAGMLEEGAAGMSANDIALGFESLGAEFGASASRDMATLSLRSLSDSDYLDPAVELFQKLASKPDFPKDNLKREKQRAIVGFARAKQQPNYFVNKRFFEAAYGNHPYAHSSSGEEADVKAITVADLSRFHKQYYVGSNAVLGIVGDLSDSQAREFAKRLAAGLPRGSKPAAIPAVKPLKKARRIHKPFQSTQTHIYMGHPGIARGDNDYFDLYVGNYILGGGGFVSRLVDRIREKEGLAYSVYSYFWPMREAGPFLMGMQTRNNKRNKALSLMRQTVKSFVKDGPTVAELKAAKQNITGGFPMRIDSNKKIAGYLAVIGFYNLPLDYLDQFIDRVNAVTVESVHDAFRRRVDPARMVTVTVGG